MRGHAPLIALLLLLQGGGLAKAEEKTAAVTTIIAEDPLVTQARDAWTRMGAMAEAMDPRLADFYADAARIHITIVDPDGSSRIIEMTGKAFKEKLAAALDPLSGNAVGLPDFYASEVFTVAVNGRVRMTAIRHVVSLNSWILGELALPSYDAPHEIIWRLRGDKMLIVEERIEIRR